MESVSALPQFKELSKDMAVRFGRKDSRIKVLRFILLSKKEKVSARK
ncbi:hypothetical protein LEP1GSC058_1619 [Leptospira fainei serovar Hurstbridge str. BUT 6]|uniref:Uncharacterized protein n=1 Tax=Leptospira fainei serovar Hurstbridge str. BUT 6 TaxID=1193011 RepID=S3V0R3_9LEPT|nr:hypothetical protein LEP1GSC058_1619 [Leptospira fainei serovar Hurstbridge str. BUT 6]